MKRGGSVNYGADNGEAIYNFLIDIKIALLLNESNRRCISLGINLASMLEGRNKLQSVFGLINMGRDEAEEAGGGE